MIKMVWLVICLGFIGVAHSADNDVLIVGGEGNNCIEDPGCINRLHPDIPMAARAKPGQTILFRTRDSGDWLGTVSAQTTEPETSSGNFGAVHPMAGPVHIEGAEVGDVLKVTLLNIDPGKYAYTYGGGGGFVPDLVEGQFLTIWRLNRDYAESDNIPGVRIPNSSFPGVISTLPGPNQLRIMLEREQELANAGGQVSLPSPDGASPEEICGPNGSCLLYTSPSPRD